MSRNGTAKPAYGLYPPENPYFGKPEQRYGHDLEKAKALLGRRLRPGPSTRGEGHDLDAGLKADGAIADERDIAAAGAASRIQARI
jgi:hypothetical protein